MFRDPLQPFTIVAFADQDELGVGIASEQARKSGDEGVHTLIALVGQPAADGQNHAAGRKIRGEGRGRAGEKRFELGIERPRKDANTFEGNFLSGGKMLGSAAAGSENHIGVGKRAAAQGAERFPNFNAMRADNRFQSRSREAHGLRYWREIGMRGEHELGAATSGAHGTGGKTAFAAITPGEYKFTISDGEAVKFRGIIQTKDTAIHFVAGGEFSEHGGEMAACALDSAGGVQLWE